MEDWIKPPWSHLAQTSFQGPLHPAALTTPHKQYQSWVLHQSLWTFS